MKYVALNPTLFNILKDIKNLTIGVRKRQRVADNVWKEDSSIVVFTKSYINQFTLRFTFNIFTTDYEISILNLKDCKRTRKSLPRLLKQKEYEIIKLTNQLPVSTHSAIWDSKELYLGYGHTNIVRNRGLQDKESELVFGEYFESSCLTLDLTEKPQLQFIQLKRPLFITVYCQHDSLIDECKQYLKSKGVDVKLYSEIQYIDNFLNLKDYGSILEVEKKLNENYNNKNRDTTATIYSNRD